MVFPVIDGGTFDQFFKNSKASGAQKKTTTKLAVFAQKKLAVFCSEKKKQKTMSLQEKKKNKKMSGSKMPRMIPQV